MSRLLCSIVLAKSGQLPFLVRLADKMRYFEGTGPIIGIRRNCKFSIRYPRYSKLTSRSGKPKETPPLGHNNMVANIVTTIEDLLASAFPNSEVETQNFSITSTVM